MKQHSTPVISIPIGKGLCQKIEVQLATPINLDRVDQIHLTPLAKTAPSIGRKAEMATPKRRAIAPLLGQRAAGWASPARTIGVPSEKERSGVVDKLQANVPKSDSYQSKRELEELITGKVGISSIATRAGSRVPANANISAIGYQRLALSPRRSLSKSLPQSSALDLASFPFALERNPRKIPTELKLQEPLHANGNSMTKDEINQAMSRVRARRAASLNKTYNLDGSPCSLITFNSHLKDEEIDKLNISVHLRGSGTSTDEGCVRGGALAMVLHEIEQVPDEELLCVPSQSLALSHVDTVPTNYSRSNSRNASKRPHAQLGFSTMSIKPFFGESVYLDHSMTRQRLRPAT